LEPRLLQIQDDGCKEINIFIHGYNLDKENDLIQYISYINDLELRGKVYIFFWGSAKVSSNDLVGKIISMIINGLWTTVPLQYKLPAIPVILYLHFLSESKDAINLGSNILRRISKVHYSRKYPINLIGFSLGTEIIKQALLKNCWERYNINNVILLGGAAGNDYNDWQVCKDVIRGKIFNVYSKEDDLLRLVLFEKTIGRNPIRGRRNKIINKRLNLDHNEYMINLSYIFNKILPNRRRSKKNSSIVYCICPYCKEKLNVKPKVKSLCSNCGEGFKYIPATGKYK